MDGLTNVPCTPLLLLFGPLVPEDNLFLMGLLLFSSCSSSMLKSPKSASSSWIGVVKRPDEPMEPLLTCRSRFLSRWLPIALTPLRAVMGCR